MISVIVPVYKVEKYLRKCVESIQKQTYTDLEIILVDDGSPDRCGEICDELATEDKRIKVIHQKNEGLSCARNVGIANSSGEYISFVDSDDYIADQMLETLIDVITESNCDISMCGCQITAENGDKIASDVFDNEILSGDTLIQKCVLPLKTAAWNKVFRKSIIQNHTFPNGKIHGEDLVFLSNVLTPEVTLATTSYCGYYYVKHPESITTGRFTEKAFDEVYCKDTAAANFKLLFPTFEIQFMIWQFRARMNVLRKIISSNCSEYDYIRQSYLDWLELNYSKLSKQMSAKMKVEYFLVKYMRPVYCIFISALRKC